MMEEDKTIERTTVEVSIGTLAGCPPILMRMKRWRDNLIDELENCLDPHECTPARWSRYSMENWWAGHPEYDANDGILEGTLAADYCKYTWVDAVRDSLYYLGTRLSLIGVTDHGETVTIEGITENSVMRVMRLILLNSGFGEKKAFFRRTRDDNVFLLRFADALDAMDDDGWKRYTWSDAKFDEAREDGRVVDVDAFNNRQE